MIFMERVCIYLRKSRADLEAEARGEGETLAKHKKTLLQVAEEQNLNIVKIREEIVSGENLIHRPEMLELLKEIEQGMYTAVLCMDMDRLGRGNMKEQGLILEAFQQSDTKIITPRKTYDLSNEWDEEYTEFETFMARRELKLITRRMQGGRIRSIEEGNYIGTRPPFGYMIRKDDKGRYLVPHPDQAQVVKMIFEWYTHEEPAKRLGTSKIANKLNTMGFVSYTGQKWKGSSVLVIIKNAVYVGRIQWKKKEEKKSAEPGKVKDTRTRPIEEWIDVKGKHESLIPMEVYKKAQEILKGKYHVPYQLENGLTNPLAGIIKCDLCGSSMIYRPYTHQRHPHIMCYNRFCSNKSARFDYVEERLLEGLGEWLEQYKIQWEKHVLTGKCNSKNEVAIKKKFLQSLERDCLELEKQKNRLHDLLERSIYDEETYLERSQTLIERLKNTHVAIETAKEELQQELQKEKAQKDIIPAVESLLNSYHHIEDPAQKNILLKSILEKAVYRKEKHQRNDDFTLILYPKLPK